MLTFYEILWIFFLYAFFGWCTEVAFQAVCHGKFINRGFLNGPVCPIYGFGVLIVILVLTPLKNNLPALFLGSVLLTSSLEFLTGFVLDKFFRNKWWDYSSEPLNIMGYVCIRFSLIWGLACVLVVDVLHPLLMKQLSWLPETLGIVFLSIFLTMMAADAVVTIPAAVKMRNRFLLMEELGARFRSVSDKIGETLATGAIDVKEKVEDGRAELEELKEKYRYLAENRNIIQERLLSSFPRLRSGRYKASFERMRFYLKSEHDNPSGQPRRHDSPKTFYENISLLHYRDTFVAIVDAMEARHENTAGHSSRVAAMTYRFCRAINMPQNQSELMEVTAAVHDIGKIGISDAILAKKSALTEDEWKILREHPVVGANLLLQSEKLTGVAVGVRHHHENWDGSGYPSGLQGEAIPLASRIVSLCDSTDAMMSHRGYKAAMTAEECRSELKKNSGVMYQPELVDEFLKNCDYIVGALYGATEKPSEIS